MDNPWIGSLLDAAGSIMQSLASMQSLSAKFQRVQCDIRFVAPSSDIPPGYLVSDDYAAQVKKEFVRYLLLADAPHELRDAIYLSYRWNQIGRGPTREEIDTYWNEIREYSFARCATEERTVCVAIPLADAPPEEDEPLPFLDMPTEEAR